MLGAWCGALGWTPRAFWRSSLAEVTAALEGWQRVNGPPQASGPTDEEIAELMARYPDGGPARRGKP